MITIIIIYTNTQMYRNTHTITIQVHAQEKTNNTQIIITNIYRKYNKKDSNKSSPYDIFLVLKTWGVTFCKITYIN